MWGAKQHDRSHRPAYNRNSGQQPFKAESTLKTETLVVERKTFVIALKENDRGRFLRITEEVAGKRNNVLIPSTGLADFQKVLHAMVEAGKIALPQADPAPER